MAIDPQIANPAALGYAQNALINRQNQQQQGFVNNLAMRDQGLQEQAFQAQQNALTKQQGLAQSKMTAEQALAGSRILQREIQRGADPMQLIPHVAPDLPAGFEQAHGPGSFSQLSKDQILQIAKQVELKAMQQLGMQPEADAPTLSTENVGGFNVLRDSTGKVISSQAPEREQSTAMTPYQMAQLQLQRDQMNQHRELTTRGQDLTSQQAATRANNANAITREQNQRTWDTYQIAMGGLRQAMAATETGPLAGRMPAVTSAQQTAEGAESAMAPVLKQIFRIAGEGTFTDKDQELLMRMVPTRKDSPQAREAKIQNIDNIIKSKLGLSEQSPQAQPAGGWSVRRK